MQVSKKIEIAYYNSLMVDFFEKRMGARWIADVPRPILAKLAAGEIESANLMEWLAADMSSLARNVAVQLTSDRLSSALC